MIFVSMCSILFVFLFAFPFFTAVAGSGAQARAMMVENNLVIQVHMHHIARTNTLTMNADSLFSHMCRSGFYCYFGYCFIIIVLLFFLIIITYSVIIYHYY